MILLLVPVLLSCMEVVKVTPIDLLQKSNAKGSADSLLAKVRIKVSWC